MTQRWYVVQTKPNQEIFATKELLNQKFNVYNPTYVEKGTSKKSGLPTSRLLPLFPSYIFIQLDIEGSKRWRSVNGTRGVVSLVGCTEDYVTPLPEGCVEDIIRRTEAYGGLTENEAMDRIMTFLPEMQLKIRGDSYAGLVGTYCNHTEKRVHLLITLLNRKIKIDLPIESVIPHNSCEKVDGGSFKRSPK